MTKGRHGASALLHLPASVVAAACGMHRHVNRRSTVAEACCRLRRHVPGAANTERAVQEHLDRAADEVIAEAVRGTGSAALAEAISQARSSLRCAEVAALSSEGPLPAAVSSGSALLHSLVREEAASCGPDTAGVTAAGAAVETGAGGSSAKSGEARRSYCTALRSAITEAVEARVMSASDGNGSVSASEAKSTRQDERSEVASHLRAHVDSWVGRSRGLAQEASIINDYERQTGARVHGRNDRTGYLRIGGTDIVLVGKVDGVDASSGMVVEVKQRRSRLFSCVPLYEKVQCEVYSRMFDTPGTIHVQRFGSQVVRTKLLRDDALWERVQKELARFENDVKRVLELPDNEIDKVIVETSRAHPLRAWACRRS